MSLSHTLYRAHFGHKVVLSDLSEQELEEILRRVLNDPLTKEETVARILGFQPYPGVNGFDGIDDPTKKTNWFKPKFLEVKCETKNWRLPAGKGYKKEKCNADGSWDKGMSADHYYMLCEENPHIALSTWIDDEIAVILYSPFAWYKEYFKSILDRKSKSTVHLSYLRFMDAISNLAETNDSDDKCRVFLNRRVLNRIPDKEMPKLFVNDYIRLINISKELIDEGNTTVVDISNF